MQQESVAISWLEVVVLAALALGGVWFLFSNLNPLWRLWESWPRALENLDLHSKCDGLLRFGLPGAHWRFVEQVTHDEIAILKTSESGESGFELRVRTKQPTATWVPDFERVAQLALGETGTLRSDPTSNTFALFCSDSARLVAVIRAAARALGHESQYRYRTFSDGPVD
jgi:hypothetical protein